MSNRIIRSDFMEALRKTYEAEILCAKANIQVYIDNPAGIGDHSDVVCAIDDQIQKLCSSSDKLDTLNRHFSIENPLSTNKTWQNVSS